VSTTAGSGPRVHLTEGQDAMGKLMNKIKKAAKSPKAKELEKKMVSKAKDPKTKDKIAKRFRKLKAKH
jgi:hypothetical protein